ncbi:MAG TPA: glycoside hydrolase family 3 protein [Steroidobacteraceae bacterium]|nr:glycoside hydrolase family 3 protein [Steroidobacteraceae bacterium]
MRTHAGKLVLIFAGAALCGAASADQDPQLEAKVAALLARMTLEQKIAQMVQADIRSVTPDDVRKYRLGSVLNGGGAWPGENKHASVADWLALADSFHDASMDTANGQLAIPVMWGTDAVHGHNNVIGATLFPHNIGLGAAHDPDLIERIGAVTAREVAVTGLDWAFAPVVAVVRDDRWGRTYESYSEDPELVRTYADRAVRGLQGAPGSRQFLDAAHVLASAKHFIGDGGTSGGVDRGDTQLSEADLLRIHGQGYVAAIGAGVQTVMASYNSWNGLKVHGQQHLLTEVLKQRMGFDGIVVSDWDGVDEVQGCSKDKCAQAINAGIDMAMVPTDWKNFLTNTLDQVRSEKIPLARVDDAVTRILRVKYRAGLFERGRPSSRPLANKVELLGAPEHRELARQAVRESLVLLKNERGLLPLRRKSHVLVVGEGADNIPQQTGGWTLTWQGTGNSNADFPGATSIFQGIARTVQQGGGKASSSADGLQSRPDVAIVVFGESPYAEWFGDLESIDYAGGAGLALLQQLQQQSVPRVCVFLSGRPLWIEPELALCNAFVAAWLPGSEGGGIADVLFRKADGRVNYGFTGKLSFSWPRAATQTSLNRNDGSYDPLFPYGFGLRY